MIDTALKGALAERGLEPGGVAAITGGGGGIGLATACRCAELEMAVALLDWDQGLLDDAVATVRASGNAEVIPYRVDVSDAAALDKIEADLADRFGGVDFVLNNAGIQPGSEMFGPRNTWQKIIGVNLWGVINGSQVFAPRMIARGRPGMIINTGSKQGITTPPGDPCYNVTKAGVKAFTEALAHELRNTDGCQISGHLLIPGFVFTNLTRRGRTEKPEGAWTADQTADFLLASLARGDFYILCPDNDVDRALDEKRMAWAIGDIIENRPALSRWHPDYAEAFADYIKR